MENLKVLFVSEDIEYGKSLCDCIRKMNTGISISIFDETSDTKEHDVILLDGIETFENADAKPVIKMRSSREECGESDVYKYDQLTKLINTILNKYSKKMGRHFGGFYNNKTKCQIYTVASSTGGAGCSSIAMGMAKDIALAGGERVLYLSIDKNSDELFFFKRMKENTIREYIYNVSYERIENRDDINEFLMMNQYGVNGFNRGMIRNAISDIKMGDVEKFLKSVVESGQFDKVILDSGSHITETTKLAINISDVIIFIRNKKLDTYEKMFLNETGISNRESKLIRVVNYVYHGAQRFNDFFEDEEEEGEIQIYREDDAFLYQDGIVDIEINGAFGEGIRKIISAISKIEY